MDYNDISIILIALGVLLLNFYIIRHYYREGRLLSLAGGVHLNVCLCMAIGPTIYVMLPQFSETERVKQSVIVENALVPYALFLVGYLITAICEIRYNFQVHTGSLVPKLKSLSMVQVFMLLLLGCVGVAGGLLGINTSGAGNVLNIFALFFFPIVTLSVVQISANRPETWFSALIINGLVGSYCITSPWRSMAVIYAISLLLGLAMRTRLNKPRVIALLLVCMSWYIWLFPFLQLKKYSMDENTSIIGLFIESQSYPFSKRLEESIGFLGSRLNSVREIGYVQNGLNQGLTELRMGESYKETLLQMVPRVVWPAKPSFNTLMNFVLPREIGLLGWEDPDTSAGVALWGEAVWNLTAFALPLFVPVMFWLLRRVDFFVRQLQIDEFFKWWIYSCLFYQGVQILSLVTFVSMITWIIVILYCYGRVFTTIFVRRNRA